MKAFVTLYSLWGPMVFNNGGHKTPHTADNERTTYCDNLRRKSRPICLIALMSLGVFEVVMITPERCLHLRCFFSLMSSQSASAIITLSCLRKDIRTQWASR